MKNLFKQIEDYDVNVYQYHAYNFYIDKLNLNWLKYDSVEEFTEAKSKGEIRDGRMPYPARVIINLTRNKIVSFYYQNRWEYDGLYMGRDYQLLEYVRTRLFFSNSSCGTCGPVGVNDVEKYRSQIRFVSYDPETMDKIFYIKFLPPNFSIKYDTKNDKEVEIKRFYLSFADLPDKYLKQMPEDFVDTFRFHNVSTFEVTGDLFIELYL